eukprot:m.106231 g.106231  ORF g.106231 m.106231 type:complete len:136 (-) comp12689_c0_seq2:904-1311(-)
MDRVHVRAPATQDIAKRSATGTTSLSKILWRNDQCARREEVGIYPRSVALGRRAIHWAAIGILIMATPIGAVGVFSGSAVQSKVLIENITELSLSRGAITTGRRSPVSSIRTSAKGAKANRLAPGGRPFGLNAMG